MKVNWDDEIPNIWENKKDVPNHPLPVLTHLLRIIESFPTWTDKMANGIPIEAARSLDRDSHSVGVARCAGVCVSMSGKNRLSILSKEFVAAFHKKKKKTLTPSLAGGQCVQAPPWTRLLCLQYKVVPPPSYKLVYNPN